MPQSAVLDRPIADEISQTQKPAVSFSHLPALDGVRGIAILIVMIYHLEWLMPTLHDYVKGGFLGVDLFFALSGFLITSILLNEYEKTSTISLKNFFIRRCLRLMPAFWFFVICLYLFGTYLLPEFQASLVYGRHDFIYALTYTMNWYSATNPGFDSNLNHTWSLSIEEQFYIIWSLILYKAFAEKRKHEHILYLTLGLITVLSISRALRALTGADTRLLYYSTDTRIDSLLMGCGVSMVFIWKMLPAETVKKVWFNLLLICSVIAAFVVTFSLSHEDRNLYVFGLPMFNLAVAIMIFWLVSTKGTIIHKVLENSILRWIGNVSYALYLWHYLLYEYAKKEFVPGGSQIFVGVTLAFVLAALSYYCVERPFLRLKSRFHSKTAV